MKFQNATGAAIFWRKIRIFLPCRVGHRILCLSMFGQSQGVSGKSADNERITNTPCGMSQTWKNTDHPGCPTRNG